MRTLLPKSGPRSALGAIVELGVKVQLIRHDPSLSITERDTKAKAVTKQAQSLATLNELKTQAQANLKWIDSSEVEPPDESAEVDETDKNAEPELAHGTGEAAVVTRGAGEPIQAAPTYSNPATEGSR